MRRGRGLNNFWTASPKPRLLFPRLLRRFAISWAVSRRAGSAILVAIIYPRLSQWTGGGGLNSTYSGMLKSRGRIQFLTNLVGILSFEERQTLVFVLFVCLLELLSGTADPSALYRMTMMVPCQT